MRDNSFLYSFKENFYGKVPFGLCDFTFCGHIDDMLKLWDVPLDIGNELSRENMKNEASEKKMICGKTIEQIFHERANAVLWISLGFCDLIGYEHSCDYNASYNYYRDLFVFFDYSCEWLFKYESLCEKRLCSHCGIFSMPKGIVWKDTERCIKDVLCDENYYSTKQYKKFIAKK